MRSLLASSIATSVFLALTMTVGAYQMIGNYQTYGFSYVETVTINGVATVRAISIWDSAFTIAILLWLIILNILLAVYVYEAEMSRVES